MMSSCSWRSMSTSTTWVGWGGRNLHDNEKCRKTDVAVDLKYMGGVVGRADKPCCRDHAQLASS